MDQLNFLTPVRIVKSRESKFYSSAVPNLTESIP